MGFKCAFMQAFDLFGTRWFVYFALCSTARWLTDDSAPRPRIGFLENAILTVVRVTRLRSSKVPPIVEKSDYHLLERPISSGKSRQWAGIAEKVFMAPSSLYVIAVINPST